MIETKTTRGAVAALWLALALGAAMLTSWAGCSTETPQNSNGGPVCTPGELRRCMSDGAVAEVCDEAGAGYEEVACAEGERCVVERGGCVEVTPQCPEGSTEEACQPTMPKICEPGERRDCLTENTPAIEVCNAEGTAFESGSCPEKSVCRQGDCVEVACLPGQRRCDTDTQVQECNESGSAFEDTERCEGSSRCSGGVCLNRCEIAAESRNYIGCEYWAVELENHLIYGEEGSTIKPEEQPPFAIVLANTSSDYDATVTVYAADGEPAQAIPQRLVGTDIQLPGIDRVTVYSELIDAKGARLQGPFTGKIENLPLPRNTVMTLIMPHRRIPFGASSLTPFAYKVVTSQPVVAYQFNPLCCNYNYTNDASLLLPRGALTENYMFMSFAVWAGGANRLREPMSPTLTVVGTEPDTRVRVRLRPPKEAERSYGELIYPTSSDRITGPDARGLMEVTLQPFEVLNIAGAGAMPVEDLTGARIEASKPVAVFGGHSCTYVPFSSPACDHLESQLFPMETWGTSFVASSLKRRSPQPKPDDPPRLTREGTYWKVLAREDGTVVNTGLELVPPKVLRQAGEGVAFCGDLSDDPASGRFTLNAGQSCEFGTQDSLFLMQASRPIMVGAFLSSQNTVKEDAQFGDHAGDPAFFLLPPREQYRTAYAFLTPATYFESFVTVTIPPNFPVILDGKPVDLSKLTHYREYPELGIVRAHIPLPDGPHTIEATIPFGIVVYGYDDYVSYAYTGGLQLTKLSPLPE